MIRFLIGLLIGLALPTVLNWTAMGNIKPLPSDDTVYAICMQARTQPSGAHQTACGDAQTATHTEFLCDQTNANCWLERK